MTIKILFITPYAKPTGSEITLFKLIMNLDRERFSPVGVVSQTNGELLTKIANDIPTYNLETYMNKILFWLGFLKKEIMNRSIFFKRGSRNINKAKLIKREVYKNLLAYVHNLVKPDIWYINTIIQPEVLEYAYDHGIPCIVHCHELEPMLINLNDEDIERLIAYPILLIACSNTSANMLRILGRNKNLEVCFPSTNISNITKDYGISENIRKRLGIAKSTFLWVMSGSTDSNKNPVRFVEIAHKLLQQNYNVHFLWIGNDIHSGLNVFVQKYADFLGISDKITWVGVLSGDDYYNHLKTADGFLLTSMRESFSLVSIEALYLGKPIVSFNCGGITEIIPKGMGHIVEYYNLYDLVDSLIKVMSNKHDYHINIAELDPKKYVLEAQVSQWHDILSFYSQSLKKQ